MKEYRITLRTNEGKVATFFTKVNNDEELEEEIIENAKFFFPEETENNQVSFAYMEV